MVESFPLCHAPANNRVALIPKSTISGIFRLCDHDMSSHLYYLSDYAPIDAAISLNEKTIEKCQGVELPDGEVGLAGVPVVGGGAQSEVFGHGMTKNKACQPA